MTISFDVDEAFEHLSQKGFVFTARKYRRHYDREHNVQVLRFGSPADFNVDVELVKIAHTWADLKEFENGSGFENAFEWWRKMLDLYKTHPKRVYVYKAVKI